VNRRVRGGSIVICVLCAGLWPASRAWAQQPASAADVEEIIVVTGTRAPDRTVLDTPVPVDVLSGEDLQRSGALGGELGSALQVLAPSFNIERQSQSGPADHVRAAQLRGMSPDQVLVLVNGKRRHTSSVVQLESKLGRGTTPVDLNTIPLSAIKRIEVLRDGAGAQYGSDAIAGVINIILDDTPSGIDTGVSYGFQSTDFAPTDAHLTDGETFVADISGGAGLGEDGFIRLGAEIKSRNATARVGLDDGAAFLTDAPYNDTNIATFGRVNYRPGDGEYDDTSLWVNSEIPLSDRTAFYGFGTLDNRDSEGVGFYRYPDSPGNVLGVYPDGFLPITTGKNEDYAVTAGLRTSRNDWAIDASLTYGRNNFDFGLKNSINASLGPTSPTEFALGSYSFNQTVANLDLRRELTRGVGGPMTIAFGGEIRNEAFDTNPGDPASYAAGGFVDTLGDAVDKEPNSQAAPGLRPEDTAHNSRDVYGAYAEIAAQPTARLFLDAAARFEHYEDFGSTAAGKFSAIYQITHAVALRGAASNSFRAPSLSQIGFSQTVSNFGAGGALVDVRTLPVADPLARALGAADLDAEKSKNFSLGVAVTLGERWSFTVDAFQIDVDDRITLSEQIDRADFPAAADAIAGTVQAANFFTNAVDTRTQGVDIVATCTLPVGAGSMSFTGAYDYAATRITGVNRTANQPAGLELIGIEETNTLTDAIPRDKFVFSDVWSGRRWSATGRLIRYGDVRRVFAFYPQGANVYSPDWELDGDLQFVVTDAVKLTFGGSNLLDRYPDRQDDNYNAAGNFPYDVIAPLGFNGRYLYASLRLSF
jgi:iron complex outermembrane recepter protein